MPGDPHEDRTFVPAGNLNGDPPAKATSTRLARRIEWLAAGEDGNIDAFRVGFEARQVVLNVVPMGALDDDPGIRPQAHIFVGSKAPWYETPGDLPQFTEYPK